MPLKETAMTDNQQEIKIIPLAAEHAREVAKLHIEGIGTGFISSLGVNFVTALYKAIAESRESFGYVAIKDSKVVGFATFTQDVNKLYKSIIRTSGIKFSFLLLRKMFSWNAIRRIFETLFYPKRIERLQLPEAEFLSMVVSPEARGYGLATRFVKTGFHECACRGIKELKILAAVSIGPINKMYEKFGFKVRTQMESHGIVSNIYVVPTDYFDNSPGGPV